MSFKFARIIILGIALYTGPGPESPAQSAQTVITVIVPAALAANPPVCSIG